MAGFIQVIEFQTSRIDEMRAVMEELSASDAGAGRATLTEDRDRPGYYIQVVEFESYEAAMENSNRPEISAFAARMAALGDGPPRFYNLNVVESWERDSGGVMKKVIAGAAATVATAAGVAAVKAAKSDGDNK